jgi:excisionase family DNA binding protein
MAHQPAPTTPPRRLRSIVFVAQYLAVDERTVRRYIASGRLPAYRLGRGPNSTIRVDLTDVENFITEAAPHEVSA